MNSTVKIIGCTENPDKITASSARISTTMGDSLSIFEHAADTGKNQALIKKVLTLGHKTIMEHISFNLAFVNVSAYVEQFMIEFRLASFTVKSRRYVDFSNMGFVVPPFTDNNGMLLKNAEQLQALYHSHITFLFQEYEHFIKAGIPKEDARFLLPYAYQSNFYCTVNARELCNILYSMLYGRGREHTELNTLGKQLLEQAKELCPFIFDHFPALESGYEHKYDKLMEIIRLYGHEKSGTDNPDKTANHSVELLTYTENPEYAVARAALIGHANLPAKQIEDMLKNTDCIEQILDLVLSNRRPRELEQIHFTFRINGVTLAAVTHLTRHRMQSIMIPSLHDVCKCERYLIPDTIQSDQTLLQRYIDAYVKTKELHDILSADGLNKQAQSYLCLSGNVIDITTTINGRELLTFINLRCCNRAQWETRGIAIDMLNLLRGVSPLLFNRFGPRCYMTGICPEGTMSCGKMQKVQEQFRIPVVPFSSN